MKRLILLCVACVLAPVASAELYKYIDKDGKTVYSDQPPPNVESKQVNVQPASGAAPAPAKSAVQRDKELEKGRQKNLADSKKAEAKANEAKAAEERCAQATDRHKSLVEGGRIWKYDEKGDRTIMSDDEIASEREKARRLMDEMCKKS